MTENNQSTKRFGRPRKHRGTTVAEFNKTPEGREQERIRNAARRYGVTPEQYQAHLNKTNCEMCGILVGKSSDGRSLMHIEHCHTTNKVRGSVCNSCNILIGAYEKAVSTGLLLKIQEWVN